MKSKSFRIISSLTMFMFVIILIINISNNSISIKNNSNLLSLYSTNNYYYYSSLYPAGYQRMIRVSSIYLSFNVFSLLASLIALLHYAQGKNKAKIQLGLSFLFFSIGRIAGLCADYGGYRMPGDIKATVVFFALMMVAAFVSLLLYSSQSEYDRSSIAMIISALSFVIVILIAIISPTGIYDYSTATIIPICLVFSLGIIGLSIYGVIDDSYLCSNVKVSTIKTQSLKTDTLEDKLITIKNLYDKSLITEEEYNQKRKEILDSYK